jgi:hypothetical protein
VLCVIVSNVLNREVYANYVSLLCDETNEYIHIQILHEYANIYAVGCFRLASSGQLCVNDNKLFML